MLRRLAYVVVAVALVACGRAQMSFPPALADRSLVEVARGEEAREEVARLHGRDIAVDATHLIGRYGDGPTMLYATVYESEDRAREDMLRMTTAMERMRGGPFAPLEFRSGAGEVRFTTSGTGLEHLIFRRGPVLLWLQAEPEIAEAAFADLVDADLGGIGGG